MAYTDSNGKHHEYIHLITVEEAAEEHRIFEPGWYFNDETFTLVGPFRSADIAIEEPREYCKTLG